MRPLIERFVRGESGVAAYSLVAAVLMLIGAGAWVVATAPRVVASTQINPLEMMANVKDLPTSLAAAPRVRPLPHVGPRHGSQAEVARE